MGRKSKSPVTIQFDPKTEIYFDNNSLLPQVEKYIDFTNGRTGLELVKCRLYYFRPSISDAKSARNDGFNLIGGDSRNHLVTENALGDYATTKISHIFAEQLCRLITNAYSGQFLSLNSIRNRYSAIKHFINFLSTHPDSKNLTIYNIQFEDWINYRKYIENCKLRDKKQIFRTPLSIFASFQATNFEGSLQQIKSPTSNSVKSSQANSLLFETDSSYSDSVMYQLLAQFIFRFERQIKNLKFYEELTIDDLGENWISPDSRSRRIKHNSDSIGLDHYKLIDSWLSNEDGYQTILNHKLMWFKLGGRVDNTFSRKLEFYSTGSVSSKSKLMAYRLWERDTHFFDGPAAKNNVFGLYAKCHPSDDKTGSMTQLAYSLSNIVMIYTGLNKEVVISWPSQINGKSILESGDNLFITGDGLSKEIEISGVKSRTGALTKDKIIRIAIVVGSPLFKMLKDYEKHAKTNFEGPFFEFPNTVPRFMGKKGFIKSYKIIDENGNYLNSINSTKFRKVFATNKMLEHMSGIKNPQELADRLRKDLDHNKLDVTLSNYILKSRHATNVLDIAIVTITSEKIKNSLTFQGKISNLSEVNSEKSLYMCECSDPKNPSHGVSFSKKCTYYDLCLGCRQSIIFERHLPYICFRILQYENRRVEMGNEWGAIFEDKWMIAHDALKKYEENDKLNGASLVAAAWVKARKSVDLLPPIIMTQF